MLDEMGAQIIWNKKCAIVSLKSETSEGGNDVKTNLSTLSF